jgi:hypothetical protein
MDAGVNVSIKMHPEELTRKAEIISGSKARLKRIAMMASACFGDGDNGGYRTGD